MGIKRWIARIWNPWAIRDDQGRVIDDRKRRKNKRETERAIRTGQIVLGQKIYSEGDRRKTRIGIGGEINMDGRAEQ